MSHSNPFAALVQDQETSSIKSQLEDRNEIDADNKKNSLNSILERIFGFSLNEEVSHKNGYMFIGKEQGCLGITNLDFNILSYCLFERLFSCNKDNTEKGNDTHSTEQQVIVYLYTCYKLYKEEIKKLNNIEDYSVILEEILKNCSTALIHPDIYYEQNLFSQVIDILLEEKVYSEEFFRDLCHAIQDHEESDDSTLKHIFTTLTTILTIDVLKTPLSTFDTKIFSVLKALTAEEKLALVFMECIQPTRQNGVRYAETLLGGLINISILPKSPNSEFEHFDNMLSQGSIETTESYLWSKSKLTTDHIYHFILNLLKISPAVKEQVLSWLGQCLQMNSDREKLWNSQVSPEFFPANYSNVTDGFMVHLGAILLRLCQPFCNEVKILKVDPTYCAVTNDVMVEKLIHLPNMSEQTSLLPVEQDDLEQRLTAESFSFTTECFYLAHRAIHLGFTVAVDKAVRMNRELGRIERAYNEARLQASGNSDIMDNLKNRLTSEMSKFLSYKAQLSEPNMLMSMFDFICFTSYWLCQVVVHPVRPNMPSYAPSEEVPFCFPLPNEVPNTLKSIPEFIIGNIVCFVVFIMRFSAKSFEEQGHEKLEHVLTFILTFMGNHDLIKNPHLRAQLAESLEALIPVHREEFGPKNDVVNYERTMLFAGYKYKKQVVKSLLEVFVGIEMTGQSVEFEQKFNYRRPMYGVMEYLWSKEEYQNYFQELAVEAETQMEAVSPPIFLRFINLLMNDAVFLLDESLTNMAKLREMQAARDNGEWDALPFNERTQNLSYLHHTGMIARFDNILGRDTITALQNLTSKINIVFTHITMVDRIAAMLNYFLLNLVGPNKKNFKVKDQKDFHFDPAETVLKICKIYINLKDSDAFCLAVSQDGRSYSPNLFALAEGVLVRIGGSFFLQEMKEVAEKVAMKAEEYKANEEATVEAPEHYLDPIMSTLMTDPVILPSSKQVVDRTTIARHLLSDQTDPFNRSPLSMDQVIPHTELAKEIQDWVQERRSRSS